jgi:hypothetical protein
MLKRTTSIALAILIVGAMTSCILDPDPKPPPPPCTDCDTPYMDLTEKWHVLHNIREAYNEMNLTEYRRAFDRENFVSFFYEGDVGTGGVPEQWGWAEEEASARNMFNQAGGIEDNPILSIELFLFDIKTVEWWELDPGDDFPGETWYQTIVVYDFFIDTANDKQYVTQGAPTVVFTVRQIDGKWKLVWWRDRSSGS